MQSADVRETVCAGTSESSVGWATSGARVLGICVFSATFLASCHKQPPGNPKSSSRSTIETIDPVFRVVGYEDKIDPDYGLPLQGLVAASVRYDLGTRFPPTDFLGTLERHLRTLGWFSPEFTFSNPPERATEAATWRRLPRAQRRVRMSEQWWVRGDEIVGISGYVIARRPGAYTPAADVYVVIARYYPAEAGRKLSEYRELHGTTPTVQADVRMRSQSDSAATAEDP